MGFHLMKSLSAFNLLGLRFYKSSLARNKVDLEFQRLGEVEKQGRLDGECAQHTDTSKNLKKLKQRSLKPVCQVVIRLT